MKLQTTGLFLTLTALLAGPGCKTTEPPVPVSWAERSAYSGKARDPRVFGFSIYQLPGGGFEYRGGTRLHPNQGVALKMDAKDPFRPVVMMKSGFKPKAAMLLDFSTPMTLLEFNRAQQLGAIPVAEREAVMVKRSGEEIADCFSMVPSLSFEQLFIESVPVYVRLANGSLGAAARGIEDPAIKGVIGWDVLKKFEQIQLNYLPARVLLSTGKTPYNPDPVQVFAALPLVKHAGACAVRGQIDGKEGLIIIDPAGDFEIATDFQGVSSVQLDPNLIFSAPVVSASPGGTRIGARLLQNYQITVCPQAGMIYFEKPGASLLK